MTTKTNWTNQIALPTDLIDAKKRLYDLCDFKCSQPIAQTQSAEYTAYTFDLNNKSICYRLSKITPTKTGQFVTLWKRNKTGTIAPFDFLDTIDFVIISVRKEDMFGQFIFPKAVLLAKGIFSTPTKEGKRATRVYPPWDETTNKQAQKTQQWQLDYFYKITADTNFNAVKKLFI